MTFFTVPVDNSFPWLRFNIVLSGTSFTLHFRYNTRMSRWIMDIADQSDTDILDGLPLLIDRNVNGQYVISGLPVGTFFAVDDTNQGTQPTRYSFGTDHTLYYADPTQ